MICRTNLLEWPKQNNELNRQNTAIPWPDNEDLGRVRNEAYQDYSATDDQSTKKTHVRWVEDAE